MEVKTEVCMLAVEITHSRLWMLSGQSAILYFPIAHKGQVIRATFSHNLSRNIVALQVEKRCCPYYHLRSQLVTQQISMLQVVAN